MNEEDGAFPWVLIRLSTNSYDAFGSWNAFSPLEWIFFLLFSTLSAHRREFLLLESWSRILIDLEAKKACDLDCD